MTTEYDFAFSFAGEDREIVEKIINGLNGYNIFYDNDLQSQLCGKDLYSYLRNLYKNQAKYVVCFISNNYKKKIWTNLEFSAIKERLLATFFASDFLIPIFLDNVLIEDIPSFLGYYEHKSISETISLLKNKYNTALNEDYHFENIQKFSEYLIREIKLNLQQKGFFIENGDDYIQFINHFSCVKYYFLPDDYSNLPCILIYKDKKENFPCAIISWERTNQIKFLWSQFTNLSDEPSQDSVFLVELIDIIVNYILINEG